MEELVSVIISSFNAEKYIDETVSSILNQTYKKIELIVVDDGSTDNTLNILGRYSKLQSVRIIRKEHTGNIGKNLNDGIKLSMGNYVCVCGADDVWESHKLEIQCAYLPKYDCISSNASLIDSNNSVLSEVYYDNFKTNVLITLQDLVLNNVIIASTTILKKTIIEECGYFDEKVGNRAEDYYLWLNVAEKYQFYFISECLIRYRKHNNNLSDKSLKDFEELSLRSIELRKKYLNFQQNIKTAARKGIFLEYSRLIKACIAYKEFSRLLFFSKGARQFIDRKISLKYFKLLLYPIIRLSIYTIIRK
jgi:glycosyltransferase involved in cell wall biosynthesis